MPVTRTDPKRGVSKVLGAAAAATVVVGAAGVITAVVAEPAAALPASQSVCVGGAVRFVSAAGWLALTPARTVVTAVDTTLKVEATADIGVDPGAEVRLGWRVDNGTPVEGGFGPADFAGHQDTPASRSTFGLISVGAGTTTVAPVVRLSAPAGSPSATMLVRCFTIEALAG